MSEPRLPVSKDLLDDLAAILSPAELTPPPERIASLRQAVMQRWPDPVAPGGPAEGCVRRGRRVVHWPRSRWGRAAGAVGVLAGLTIGGSGVAFAAGAAPEPIRAAAHALGFPVDSPALSAAKDAERRLRADLGTGPHSTAADSRAAASEARILARRMADLSPSDRRKLGTTALLLLGEARDVDSGQAGPRTTLPPERSGDRRRAPAPTGPAVSGGTLPGRTGSAYPDDSRNAAESSRSETPSRDDHPSTSTSASSPTSDPRTGTTSPSPAPATGDPTRTAGYGSGPEPGTYPTYPTYPAGPGYAEHSTSTSTPTSTSTSTATSLQSPAYPIRR